MSSFKILCIEDSREAQQMLTFVLTKAGYEVITADDGPQGIEKAKAWRPALILVDMMMPGMTGAEVVRQLRTSAAGRSVPILILSAYEDVALVEEARAAGADDYLVKTIPSQDLISVIEDYLRVGQTMLIGQFSLFRRNISQAT